MSAMTPAGRAIRRGGSKVDTAQRGTLPSKWGRSVVRLLDLGLEPWDVRGYWHHGGRFRPNHPLIGPLPARVPGAIQDDLQRAGILPDLNVGFHSREAEWVEHRDWVYRTQFAVNADRGSRQYLHLCGLDFSGEITLNGLALGRFRGMFQPLDLEVTGQLRPAGEPNDLVIAFDPPPEGDGQIGYSSQVRVLKSRFNYQWDWCPRIVPVGIWDDALLECSGPVRLQSPYLQAGWSTLAAKGSLAAQVLLEGSGAATARVRLTVEPQDGSGPILATDLKAADVVVPGLPPASGPNARRIRLEDLPVQPWWPAGHGDQPLYRVRLEVLDAAGVVSDESVWRVGFRDLRLVPNPNGPKDALPYTCLCNDRRIYLQGVNWAPLSPLYGTLRRADYAPVLERFRRMGCALLRVWGGAFVEKQAFFDLCDEKGLLVWQEFHQSSSGLDNTPCTDADVVAELVGISRTAVRRRRHHASLAVWCGGNELTWPDGRPAGLDHPTLARLAEVVAEEDPVRTFLPASPSGPHFAADPARAGQGVHHDVHGPWTYGGHPDHYRYWDRVDGLLHSEVGAPGASRLEVIERVAADGPLWPPNRDHPLWLHHGDWWVQWDEMTNLFGPWKVDQPEPVPYLSLSRYLQAEALRYAASAVRRREPQASGFLVWAGTEPYANTANCALLEYDGGAKPAYGWLQRAFAPVYVSCRYSRVACAPGTTWEAEAFLHLGTSVTARHQGWNVRARLCAVDGTELVAWAWRLEPAGAVVTPVGALQWPVAPVPHAVFLLCLEGGPEGEAPIAREVYAFTTAEGAPLEALRHLPAPTLATRRLRTTTLEVANQGTIAALSVHLGSRDQDVCPNDFTLLPGEAMTVELAPLRADAASGPLTIEALSLPVEPV